MARISTGTGDDGTTGLANGERVRKDAARVDACGAVDEANAILGRAATLADEATRELLRGFQRDLFTLGADLASPEGTRGAMRVDEEAVRRLEPVRGRLDAAELHLARTVVRRAERRAWALARSDAVSRTALVYLNRLSDCLFLLAREANARAGVADPEWAGRGG